jgi:hypothetical protein
MSLIVGNNERGYNMTVRTIFYIILSALFYLAGHVFSATAAEAQSAQKTTTISSDSEPLVKELPAPISNLVVAKGGAFLLLYMRELKQIAVFDVKKREIAYYLKVDSDKALFTAGATKIIVCTDGYNLQRYDLSNGQLETTSPLQVPGPLLSMEMGSNSEGPLLVQTKGLSVMNIRNFRVIPVKSATGTKPAFAGKFSTDQASPVRFRASAEGSVFGIWVPTWPDGCETVIITGSVFRNFNAFAGSGMVLPGPDGKFVYTTGNWSGSGAVLTSNLKTATFYFPNDYVFFPTCDANYFGGIPRPEIGQHEPKLVSLSIFRTGVNHPLAVLPRVGVAVERQRQRAGMEESDFTLEKRFHFVPSEKMIITIPFSNDRLLITSFDPIASLKKNNDSYLIVTSSPPANIARGETVSYQLKVESSHPSVHYKMDSGPTGAQVTAAGLVTFNVPEDFPEKEIIVIVKIGNDGGEETYHNFKINVAQ